MKQLIQSIPPYFALVIGLAVPLIWVAFRLLSYLETVRGI